jgi:protocatechuate 3,4-dioxygenase alpha subunit
MGSEPKWIPSSSQTVGPYFRIGQDYLIDRMAEVDADAKEVIQIRGRVLDGDRKPVPDAMLEFWNAGDSRSQEHGIPVGFRRVATDLEGYFTARIWKPVPILFDDGRMQAPHVMVLVFARGLMRHLISRVYLEHAKGNESDPVMVRVPAERRGTLIAKLERENTYLWDVVLQGDNETVFFAW